MIRAEIMMMNEKLTISVQVADEQVKTALEGIISDAEDFMASQPRGLDHLDFLIMELDENNPTKTFSQIEANLKGFPQTDIFLTSKTIDAPTLLHAFRSGVKEFIPQPLNRDEVRQIFARAQERHQGCSVPTPSQKSTGRVISLLGGKAGAGVTTLTVNLGVSLQNLGKSVVILDFNFHSGDVPIFLDLQPARGIFDVARNLARLDDTFLLSCLTTHSSGVSILSLDEERPPKIGDKRTDKITSSTMDPLLELLKGLFDYVLIDCGTVLDERMVKIFEQSAMLFVLYTLRLPVIKKTQRLLQLLDEIGYPKEKRKLILNAFDPEAEVLMHETESIFETKVFMKIMEDLPSANTAVNSGIPMVIGAPKTVAVEAFHNLAYFLIGKKRTKKKNGSKFNLAAFSLTGVRETWASLKAKWLSPKVSPSTPQEIKT